MDELAALAREQYGYLTTTGRNSGKAHTIEIWFAAQPGSSTLYMLAGGGHRADWVKNIQANPDVLFRIASTTFKARGRIVQDPDEERTARALVVRKYYNRDQVASTGWEATSLPIAIDMEALAK